MREKYYTIRVVIIVIKVQFTTPGNSQWMVGHCCSEKENTWRCSTSTVLSVWTFRPGSLFLPGETRSLCFCLQDEGNKKKRRIFFQFPQFHFTFPIYYARSFSIFLFFCSALSEESTQTRRGGTVLVMARMQSKSISLCLSAVNYVNKRFYCLFFTSLQSCFRVLYFTTLFVSV